LFELVSSGYVFVDVEELGVVVESCSGVSVMVWFEVVVVYGVVVVGGFLE